MSDREMTELEAFQQEELRIMANELARSGKCVKGGSILCDERYYSCQECWLAWVRDKAKRHLKGDAMTERQKTAIENAQHYIRMADKYLCDVRREFPDSKRFKGDVAYAREGLDQAWSMLRIMAKAVEGEERKTANEQE